jgi:hypothetical protein
MRLLLASERPIPNFSQGARQAIVKRHFNIPKESNGPWKHSFKSICFLMSINICETVVEGSVVLL